MVAKVTMGIKSLVISIFLILILSVQFSLAQTWPEDILKKIEELKALAKEGKEMPDLPGITKIDGAKAYELWKGKRAIFLDNRIKSHHDTEKIPGSRWFFTDSLIEKGASMANELDKTKTYVLYCNGVVCWRSPAAALILKHLGFNILWYKEGLPDWKKRGYPIE